MFEFEQMEEFGFQVHGSDVQDVPASSIKPHPRNARVGDVSAIRESIRENGFFGACIVQESTRYILAGNHRYLAAVAEGATMIPCVFVDVEEDAAQRILLADNRTADLADYDHNALAEVLQEVSANGGLSGTT
jgi:ParB-like chromosome segregation protein Spo0J